MERKVLIMISWHSGIPDGAEKVSFLVDKFDINNEKLVLEKVKEVLINYGVEDLNISTSLGFTELTGTIGRFDKPAYGGFVFACECNIIYECKYIWEDEGDLFDFNPAMVEGLIIKK